MDLETNQEPNQDFSFELNAGALDESLATIAGRLEAAAGLLGSLLEQAAGRVLAAAPAIAAEAGANLGPLVATIESARESELEQKLAAAESSLAAAESRLAAAEAKLALQASAPAAVTHSGRKTLPPAMVTLLSKQGVAGDAIASLEAGALDAALVSLSMEQRIAVKAQLLRAGLLG